MHSQWQSGRVPAARILPPLRRWASRRSRATAIGMFENLGFTVYDAYNGHHALALLEARPEIAVMFIDVRMPDMSGPELAENTVPIALHQFRTMSLVLPRVANVSKDRGKRNHL